MEQFFHVTHCVDAHPDRAGSAAIQDFFQCTTPLVTRDRNRKIDSVGIDVAEAQALRDVSNADSTES